MAGLSLTGAFAGAQLGAPAPAARVSHTGFSVVAVRAFRRSQLFPSRDRRIASARAVARAPARRATPANARWEMRAFEDGVHRRVARLPMARADPGGPARRVHRSRASSFRVRVWVHCARDAEDKWRSLRAAPRESPRDASRRAAFFSTPRSAPPLASFGSTAHHSRFPRPSPRPDPQKKKWGKAGAQPERQPRSPPHAREDQRQGGGDHRR